MNAVPDVQGHAQNREALESAKGRLEVFPASIQQRLAMAEACFRLAVLPDTEIEQAVELMRKAVAADPYHPKLVFHLGRLLHKSGDPWGAVLEYRRALRLAPRSHRTWVHLAMALNDLGADEQAIGLRTLEATQAGDDKRLSETLTALDEQIGKRIAPDGSGKTKKEKEAPPGSGNERRSAEASGRPRWKGIWKLLALRELARAKPAVKVAERRMEEGKALVEGTHGVAEYAVATLLFVADGPKTCRQIQGWLREPPLAAAAERPSVVLVRAVCELGETRTAGEFVTRAAEFLAKSELPPELVCCLHYCWWGLSDKLEAPEALALLEKYPRDVRELPCFRDLGLAILDHHARLAWSANRLDRAEIFWRETIALDPTRVAVAHNLALAVTRAKVTERYAPAWERAVELRYLLAASTGDVRVELDDRRRLHQSFRQQSRLRYLPEGQAPSENKLRDWMRDRDALMVWLQESTLDYLNARLRFMSPVHLLGVARDCSAQEADAANANLLFLFEMCFRDRGWAGGQVFLKLVEDLAGQACRVVKDSLANKRDTCFEIEAAAADQLADETIARALLMFRMLELAAAPSGADIRNAGLQVGRFLLTLPWGALEPLCKKKGKLSEDQNVVPIFVSYLMAMTLSAGKDDDAAAFAKVAAINDCIRALPGQIDLRLGLCRILLQSRRHRETYHAALEALPMTAKLEDRRQAAQLESQFVICLDNAVLGEIPKDLQSPKREQAPAFVECGQGLLAQFPKAGALRLLMADFLIQTADDDRSRLVTAAKLLEDGFDLLLTEEHIRRAHELLEKAGSRSKSIDALREVRALLESASRHARTAVAALEGERTPAKVRTVTDELEAALWDAAKAEEVAAAADLPAAVQNAKTLADDLRKILDGVKGG